MWNSIDHSTPGTGTLLFSILPQTVGQSWYRWLLYSRFTCKSIHTACELSINVHFLIPFLFFLLYLWGYLRDIQCVLVSTTFLLFPCLKSLQTAPISFVQNPFFSSFVSPSFSLFLPSVSLSFSAFCFSLFLRWSFSLLFLSPCLLQSMATSLNLPDTTSDEGSEGVRRRKSLIAMHNRSSLCTDPNCDTRLLRMRQELQLTKLKLKQVEHLSRKQQLQLQGRLNLSNDCSFAQEEGRISQNSTRGRTSYQETSSSSKGASEGRSTKGKVIVKDDSVISSSKAAMRKDKVSNVPSRPKSSLAFVQIETVI